MAGMNHFAQGGGVGRQLTETATEGVDEQNHQCAPEAVMQGTGDAIGEPGRCRCIERRSPDPGRGHAGGTHAEADAVIRDHEAVGVVGTMFDSSGQQIGAAVEGKHQQQYGCRGKLK